DLPCFSGVLSVRQPEIDAKITIESQPMLTGGMLSISHTRMYGYSLIGHEHLLRWILSTRMVFFLLNPPRLDVFMDSFIHQTLIHPLKN
ncbi:MAG TPA: hypothetical protein DCZ04_14635, partial [Syntrophorhabdus aromaticivorans]|nr:hypothetical protein [Syntrophorhabdus aromaticivorans]